jgi:hypothetical protein
MKLDRCDCADGWSGSYSTAHLSIRDDTYKFRAKTGKADTRYGRQLNKVCKIIQFFTARNEQHPRVYT